MVQKGKLNSGPFRPRPVKEAFSLILREESEPLYRTIVIENDFNYKYSQKVHISFPVDSSPE